jgi:hypothetical protein
MKLLQSTHYFGTYHVTSNLTGSFSHIFFFEMKIRVCLKFEVLFFTLQKCRKHHFPRRKSGHPKGAEKRTDKCICLQDFPLKMPF